MKNKYKLLYAILALAVLLSGCQKGGLQVMEQPKDTVNLRFCGFKVGQTKVEEIETILNRYMEQNDDTVIVYEGIDKDYVDVLTNRIESGHTDDLFMLHPQAVTTYAAKDWYGTKIADLSGEEFIDRYSPTVRKLITVDGKIPAVPLCLSAVRMLGNMDILRECGIEKMPDTFDEWVADMKIVKEHGYTPMVNYLGNDASLSFLMAGRSTAPYLGKRETMDPDITAADVYAKGITDIYQLVEAGLIDREQLSRETDPRSYQTVLGEQFASGTVAFAVAPSWGTTAFLAGEPDFAYQYGGLPVGDDGSLLCVRAAVLVAVNNEGEHKEEAADFLDFLMRPEHIESYAASQNALSPLAGAKSEDPLFAEALTQIEAGQIFSDTDPRIPFNLVKLLNQASTQMAQGESLETILDSFSAGVAEGSTGEE